MFQEYFSTFKNVNQVKAEYRRLVWIHHPDRGGDTATMQDLNNQYQEALVRCDGQTTKGTDGKPHTYHYNEEIEQAIIDKISELIGLKLDGIEIWLIGTWVWVGGDTKPHKEALKAAKCRWHSKRQKWYFHTGKYRRRNSKASFADLAATYGAKKFENRSEDKIALA